MRVKPKNVFLKTCSLGLLIVLVSLFSPVGKTQAQSVSRCNFTTASLNPSGVFQGPINDYAQNILNLRPTAISVNPTVNSANLLQNAQVNFVALNGRASGVFFNLNLGQNFPPTGTATLPRAIFNPLGVLGFYVFAADLTPAQLQNVQNVYAVDQISRRNYAFNVANLARHLTALQNAGANPNIIAFGLNTLRTAYNTLSNPANPAPDPRRTYRAAAATYIELMRNIQSGVINDPANVTQSQLEGDLAAVATTDMANTAIVGGMLIQTGLNILGIGLSNYDTNRLPVPNGNNAPTPSTAPPGTFPLTDFDTARNTPLSPAQVNPAGTFGGRLVGLLRQYGLTRNATAINYQVNSADALQAVFVPIGNSDNTLTILFAAGYPVTPNRLPQFAFSATSASQYLLDPLNRAVPSPTVQARLTSHYNNPVNAGRRNNYVTNLNNINCVLVRIQQGGGLNGDSSNTVQNAIVNVNAGLQTLAQGGVPDIFNLYQSVGKAAFALGLQPLVGANQATDVQTLRGSLLPIGIINYYLVPITLLGNGDTIGIVRGTTFFLRNSNTTGFADVAFDYGSPTGDVRLVGDWDGDGVTTPAVFRNGVFFLRNSNTGGFADTVFAFGSGLPGDIPIVGDWNGDGVDTVGVFNAGVVYLRNANAPGAADITFSYGISTDVPIAGDWNGDGVDTIGVVRGITFFLRNSNTTGFADIVFDFGTGARGEIAFTGDWDGDGVDTVGVYSGVVVYLRNVNAGGFADVTFAYGSPGDLPIAGDWDGLP
jgi:hypothetical protein